MRESDRKKGGSNPDHDANRAPARGATDTASAQLARLGGSIGNEALQTRLAVSNASRDEVIGFISRRLETVRKVQLEEIGLTGRRTQRDWWMDVADIHKDLGKPDPKRWKETARLYERALDQICAGSLGRGKELVEQAIREERKQVERLTKLVKKQPDIEAPEALREIVAGQACSSSEIPEEAARQAKEIQRCMTHADDPPVRQRTDDPWWTEQAEEEVDADSAE